MWADCFPTFFFPLWIFHTSARAAPSISTVTMQISTRAHLEQCLVFLQTLNPFCVHNFSNTCTSIEWALFVGMSNLRSSSGVFCVWKACCSCGTQLRRPLSGKSQRHLNKQQLCIQVWTQFIACTLCTICLNKTPKYVSTQFLQNWNTPL